jgi:hypothetical protein
METQEVNHLLRKVLSFKGTFARDRMPKIGKRPISFVINTDSSSEPGEHWVAIILLANGRGEFFDSFGLPPLHEDFVNYLTNNAPNGWIWNNLALQAATEKSCGLFCIEYIKARAAGLSLVDFLLSSGEHLLKNN